MNHFSFLLLSIAMISLSVDTHCMAYMLANKGKIQLIRTSSRSYSYQSMLRERIGNLENRIDSHEKELAKIKSAVGRWEHQEYYRNFVVTDNPRMDEVFEHPNSFIDKHNMHYHNPSEKE